MYLKRWIVCVLLLSAANTSFSQTSNKALQRVFENYYQQRLQLSPLDATFSGDHRYDDQLPAEGAANTAAMAQFCRRYQDSLRLFHRESLDITDRISYDVLQAQLQTGLDAAKLHLEYLPMNQFISTPALLGMLGSGTSAQPFNTVHDYDNWFKRAQAAVRWIDTAIYNFSQGVRAGVVLPKALVIKLIPQMADLAKNDSSNIFYQPLGKIPASFTTAERAHITQGYQEIIGGQLLPAFEKLTTYLQQQYLPAATTASGLYALPGGKEMYAYWVHYYTTTNDTPEEIYQTGLREVARITGEMEALKKQVGFKGSLQQFFHYLQTDKKFMPFTTPEQVLDAYRRIYDKIMPHLAELFDVKPKAGFEIRRFEAFREASQAGPAYTIGSIDGKRPGTLYIPVPDASKVNVTFYGLESTFIHEAIPGHHYQISLQQENTALPSFRRQPAFNVYLEGWALYVETLGKQLGCYTDPYQQMGSLNMEIHRAIRLVLDVALHTGKMTREQAIDYMMQHEAVSESIAVAEVERYMAAPGQALSYKMGSLKILELRDKYQRLLGPKFSLRKFHHALLTQGDMPLTVLERYLQDWAASL